MMQTIILLLKEDNEMEISAKLVKELRDKTGAGMMDCKRALIESNGNVAEATVYLRKKGLMDASKKASRIAADGLIAVATSDDGKETSIIEVNSETDFVARNDKFQNVVTKIANTALQYDSVEEILNSNFQDSNKSIGEELNLLISIVGENITLRRCKRIRVENGFVSSYIHGAVVPGMGKIGVVVALENEVSQSCDKNKLSDLGKKLAMHIAAANPAYLCTKCVPQDVIDREKDIVIAQAKESGKPDNVIEKMAEGRVKKFHEENVLLEQVLVMDGKTKVLDFINNVNKESGMKITIKTFVKFVLGEGIEKPAINFTEEVQSFIK
jgi:elongation factor Ts